MSRLAPTLRDRLRYRLDRLISAGPHRAILLLGVASAVLVLAGAAVLFVWEPGPFEVDSTGSADTFGRVVWKSLGNTLDPSAVQYAETWPQRVTLTVVAVLGVLIVGTLVGIVSSAAENRMQRIRRGRSPVLERDHVLVLGWNATALSVLRELHASAAEDGATVVVLASREKPDMEDDVRTSIGPEALRRIVFRHGDPSRADDVHLVSPGQARSALVLAPDDAEDPDASAVATLLALARVRERGEPPLPVTAEIRDPRNYDAARTAGGPTANLVLSDDFVARIAVQICRQPGLGAVYTDLLDFAGAEIHFRPAGSLAGATFGGILRRFPDAVPIGRRRAGRTTLVPDFGDPVAPGDEIVLVAGSAQSAEPLSAPAPADESAVRAGLRRIRRTERTLVLGWNRRGRAILRHLDRWVAPGSQVTIVTDAGDPDLDLNGGGTRLRNHDVFVRRIDRIDRDAIRALTLAAFDRVLVLPCCDDAGAAAADARTLAALLHLRAVCDERGESLPVVSEVLDARNRELADAARVDDFVVSSHLVSLALAQVAASPARAEVLADLLSPAGAELTFVRAAELVSIDRDVVFRTVVESASRSGAIAIGWWRDALRRDPDRRFGIELNPPPDVPTRLGRADCVVLLSRRAAG